MTLLSSPQQKPSIILSADGSADLSRRDVLRGAGVAAGLGILSCGLIKPVSALASAEGAHRIYFRNSNTGESFNGVYRVGDKYLPEAFEQISHILRDYRNGEVFPMYPRSIDILYVAQKMLDTGKAFDVLSGYLPPRTNAMLSRVS